MEKMNNLPILRRVGVVILAAAALASLSTAPAAAVTAERSLAKVKIFAPMSLVLKMYGTPTEVRVGSASTEPQGANGQVGGGFPGAGGGFPGGGGGYPGAGGGGGFPGAMGGGGYPGGGGSTDDSSGGGGYPGAMGGGGYPGAGGGGFPGAAGGMAGGTTDPNSGITIQRNMVTWIYDQPKDGSLEFTFSSDGRVVQIHATGLAGNVRTQRGVGLGAKMSEVFGHYGFPERQMITGRILNAIYIDKFHAAFQFYHGRCCGIIVAAVD
jgi:hypothetical protein